MFMKRNILSDFGGSSRTSPVSSRLPSEGANSLRPSPELRRGQNRSDFEIDQVIPMRSPGLQQLQALCLHELETARPAGLHPTGDVLDSGRQHPAVRAKALAHLRQTAGLEVFNDHEEHGEQFTQSMARYDSASPHRAMAVRRTTGILPVPGHGLERRGRRTVRKRPHMVNCLITLADRSRAAEPGKSRITNHQSPIS